MKILEVYDKYLQFIKPPQIYLYKNYLDLKILGIYVSKDAKISIINLTKHENIVLDYYSEKTQYTINKFNDVKPDNRIFRINFEINKGDILRIKASSIFESRAGGSQVKILLVY